MHKAIEKQHIVYFGSRAIRFSLTFADRKSLGIQVYPDRSIKVIAPLNAGLDQIYRKLKAKAPWIIKQQDFFLSFHPLTSPRKFVSGETHLYLGRQYRLKIHINNERIVKLKGGFIHVWIPSREKETVAQLVESWYREKAKKHFFDAVKRVIPRFGNFDLPKFKITIRKMEKRWGSCSPSGNITLNLELIKAAKGCIEYVIIHEICHLIYPNHTRSFYNLQEAKLPDWQKWKNRLEQTLS